ncbi:hypothetical protein BDU57DRAFT_528553 [Ampelomyces quisqualis]|uniref:Uncharacterized protein n=1 Tax=Ampelomyces quisqualis TaxID=50730 RepID=A0A6A5QU39_AMPQU|nr:hypothetical protein BDU57DRAFT_528553 [Ampelomyces quisqualis]
MQAILHPPKFVHWIFSHNSTEPDAAIKFPCRNLDEVGPALHAKHLSAVAVSSKNKIRLQRCPACQIKQFVRAYWGNNNIDPNRPLDPPRPWTHNHPEMRLLRDLDTELYKLTPGAASRIQQDPTEFQDRILEGCLASTDATHPGNDAWIDTFNGLFVFELKQTWRCACGALQRLPPGHFSERIGIENLPIEPAGTRDSVSGALARQMRPRSLVNLTAAGQDAEHVYEDVD